MSFVISSDIEPDTDISLGLLNVRVSSIDKSIQFSSTSDSFNILYGVNYYTPSTTSFVGSSNNQTITSTPSSLNVIINNVNDFVKLVVVDVNNTILYTVTVACVDTSPLYLIAIKKY